MITDSPRVLIIRRRYLGDIVLLGSLISNLRKEWPGCIITVLTEENYSEILTINPHVNEVLALPGKDSSLFKRIKFFFKILFHGFDYTLNIDNNERTAMLTFASRAPARATLNIENIPIKLKFVYNRIIDISSDFYSSHHITETYLRILEVCDITASTRKVSLYPDSSHRAEAAKLLSKRLIDADGKIRIGIHPGSRSEYRQWPAERFAVVADELQLTNLAAAVLIAGPGESEFVHKIADLMKTEAAIIEDPLPLPLFAAMLEQFNIMLCHDSGPMHIASAVKTPVIALYGSQQTEIWHPLGDENVILQAPLTDNPDGIEDDEDMSDSYKNRWVKRISVDEVMNVMQQQIEKQIE